MPWLGENISLLFGADASCSASPLPASQQWAGQPPSTVRFEPRGFLDFFNPLLRKVIMQFAGPR
jgi:hypothetical protein